MNLLESIQQGRGKEIARALFYTYINPIKLTEQLYPLAWKSRRKKYQKGFVMPIIANHFSLWKKNNFLDESNRKLSVLVNKKQKKGNEKVKSYYLPSQHYLYIMNLEPIFKYCEGKNIIFTPEERESLLFKFDFKDENIREAILNEFPEEDIITAFLKFYTKNIILKYTLLLKEFRENKDKYKKYEKKAEERNNPTTSQGKLLKKASEKMLKDTEKDLGIKLGIKRQFKEDKWDAVKVYIYSLGFSNGEEYAKAKINDKIPIKEILFRSYITQRAENKELFDSIENKILSALGILP